MASCKRVARTQLCRGLRPFPERHSVGLWRFSCLKRQRPARGKSCFRPFADYLLWQALVDLTEAAATMQPSVRRALEGTK
jgi:hypothetical protein